MTRGRPPSVDSELIIKTVLKYKNEIIYKSSENAIQPEKDRIWSIISEELSNRIKPSSMYSYITNNRFNLKNLLFDKNVGNDDSTISADDNNISSSSVSEENGNIVFMLTMRKVELDELVIETIRKCKTKRGKAGMRVVNVLHPQKWTEIISKKIYDDFRMPHGYHFKSNYINQDKETGSFSGKLSLKILNKKK